MISWAALAQATGLTGVFASRVFLPLFVAALVLRFGPDVAIIHQLGLLSGIDPAAAPTWFTHDITLWVLGSLAAIELLAHKNPEARQLLNDIDQYAKPVAAALAVLGIASVADTTFVQGLMGSMGPTDLAVAGPGLYLVTAFVAGGTFIVASAHNALIRNFIDIDDGDDTGLMGLLSWGQDLWAAFGIFFLILFPIVMFVLIMIGVGIILLLQRRAQRKEERSKLPCPNCQQPMYRSALACANCGNANPAPTRLNWLGASTALPTGDRDRHALSLLAHKRCRRCATRLPRQSPHQQCPACHAQPFSDPAVVGAYDRMIAYRLPPVLLIGALLSMVPVVGLIPGVIYYRLALVAPFRRYLGWSRSILLRWLLSVAAFVLVLMQVIPGLGTLAVPILALLSYAVHRRAFFKQVEATPTTTPASPIAA